MEMEVGEAEEEEGEEDAEGEGEGRSSQTVQWLNVRSHADALQKEGYYE